MFYTDEFYTDEFYMVGTSYLLQKEFVMSFINTALNKSFQTEHML